MYLLLTKANSRVQEAGKGQKPGISAKTGNQTNQNPQPSPKHEGQYRKLQGNHKEKRLRTTKTKQSKVRVDGKAEALGQAAWGRVKSELGTSGGNRPQAALEAGGEGGTTPGAVLGSAAAQGPRTAATQQKQGLGVTAAWALEKAAAR